MSDGFKAPSAIPQDLLLIQNLIGEELTTQRSPKVVLPAEQQEDEDISSSGSESESEREVAADLMVESESDDVKKDIEKVPEPAASESDDTSDSDDDSDDAETKDASTIQKTFSLDLDEDEDPLPAPTSGAYFQTKHEVADAEFAIPTIERVGDDVILEKVGEVMNVMERIAIVKGLPSENLNRGSERALDSETLLVFDDRTVLGYIYETFGPTTRPLYQIKFSATFPLDPDRVQVGREVFHVPTLSHFVFLDKIKAMKGSDASNVYDEEPADDELEFSDDEAEAAYKSRMKRKRGESRARSVASSRQSTPNPSLMHDQDLGQEDYLSRNAFDEHGPYDIDFSAPGPSRRAPISYDDPYGDFYTAASDEGQETPMDSVQTPSPPPQRLDGPSRPPRGRGRGRLDRERGRGRGRGQGRKDHRPQHQHQRQLGGHNERSSWNAVGEAGTYDNTPHTPHHLNETRSDSYMAFNQQGEAKPSYMSQAYSPNFPVGDWNYPSHEIAQQGYMQQAYSQQQYNPYQQQMFGQAAPFVQPHINPRFASALGMSWGTLQQQQQQQSPSFAVPVSNSGTNPLPGTFGGAGPSADTGSVDQWTVPIDHPLEGEPKK